MPSHSVSLESSTGKASAGIINDVGGENFISNGSLFFCRFEYYKYLNCTKIIIEINWEITIFETWNWKFRESLLKIIGESYNGNNETDLQVCVRKIQEYF